MHISGCEVNFGYQLSVVFAVCKAPNSRCLEAIITLCIMLRRTDVCLHSWILWMIVVRRIKYWKRKLHPPEKSPRCMVSIKLDLTKRSRVIQTRLSRRYIRVFVCLECHFDFLNSISSFFGSYFHGNQPLSKAGLLNYPVLGKKEAGIRCKTVNRWSNFQNSQSEHERARLEKEEHKSCHHSRCERKTCKST